MVWQDDLAGKGPCCQVCWAEFSSWTPYSGGRERRPPWLTNHITHWNGRALLSHPVFWLHLALTTCITSWHIKKEIEPSVLFVSENPFVSLAKMLKSNFSKPTCSWLWAPFVQPSPTEPLGLEGASCLDMLPHTVSCLFHLINQEEWFAIAQPSPSAPNSELWTLATVDSKS